MNMNSRYNPHEIEDRIYKNWMEKKYFEAKVDKSREPFTIVIPPPNVTGKLHMGHALNNTIQDIFVRYNRMLGKNALWLPGTDHAAIATENKVAEKLKEEGKSKEELGREEFLKEAWKWKELYGGRIIEQLKKLGASCDWSRERFTMDEGLTKAVEYVFVNLYNKDLIYRGERIVNWCPKCKTSISDTEVEYEEKDSFFWHIKYKVEDSDEYIEIATTRPETLLGDTAVAVHPSDERYKKYIGKNVILPLVNRLIPIVADEYVEMDFGTGVVKITPAHDPNDFEVGLRHGLPVINVMSEDATIVDGYGRYSKMTREDARIAIVEDLEKIGALIETEPYKHNVGSCYRCNSIVEPYASKQWFVRMKELAKPAIQAVKNGETRFTPERFEKIYFNWMENIKDWCVSRQLWWGHRIPAYHCEECNNIDVSLEKIKKCSKCGSEHVHQDEDTLDTWFSSALWPFSTLGWPDKTEDLEYFYPTTMLITAYDIITFWVSKMIFSAIEHTGQVPFKDVYIHGLIRDSLGRKMSKSLGNGVDPLEVIEKYGTDALRFSLVQNISAGNDIRYMPEKVESGGNFANKIWNAARFSLGYIDKIDNIALDESKLLPVDKWIIWKLSKVIEEVTNNINSFEIGVSLQTIYDFIWSDICDNYIEMIKPRLYDEGGKGYKEAIATLNYVLINALKLLHPYMPFITEEIFMNLKHNEESIMIAKWPTVEYHFDDESKFVLEILDMIKQIRNIRAESNIPNSKKTDAIICSKKYTDEISSSMEMLTKMLYLEKLEIKDSNNVDISNMTTVHTQNIDIYLDMTSVIDKDTEKQKLLDEKNKVQSELDRASKMLKNEAFVAKAPSKLIESEKEKVQKYTKLLEKIEDSLEKFN